MPKLALVVILSIALTSCFGAEGEYELHEWGVFSVPRNEQWAQQDMKQEWASFPAFFCRVWPDRRLPYFGPVKKPVIFLHSTKRESIALTIRFAEGRPIVWWPSSSHPVEGGMRNNAASPDTLSFQLEVGEPVTPEASRTGYKPVDADHWIQKLRGVNCSDVITSAGYSRAGDSWNRERFVYYDGLMKAPATPVVERSGNKIELSTKNDFSLLDVMIIDRDGSKVRTGKWIDKIESGNQKTSIELTDSADIEQLKKDLAARLAAAGLNADEADSLVKVWDEGIFKKDGLTLFYRVPQDTYEKWLPLKAEPSPKKTIRVGIVLHEHLEPELDARVEALIAKLGSEEFSVREAAQKQIVQIGGAAFTTLQKHFDDKDAEIARSCKKIYEALDTLPALKN